MVLRCVMSSTLDVVVMKRHAYVIGSRTGLRTMLSAGVLAVLVRRLGESGCNHYRSFLPK